jgi:hypothetical protein
MTILFSEVSIWAFARQIYRLHISFPASYRVAGAPSGAAAISTSCFVPMLRIHSVSDCEARILEKDDIVLNVDFRSEQTATVLQFVETHCYRQLSIGA